MKDMQHVLEEFPLKAYTSSLNERKLLIENVINLLSKSSDVNEDILKEICKAIHSTLPRYVDKPSRELIQKLVSVLSESDSKGIKYLCGILVDISKKHQNIVVTPSVSRNALSAFIWSCLVFKNGWKNNNKILLSFLSNLVESQAILYSCVLIGGNRKYADKAFKTFTASLKDLKDSEKLYLDTLSKLSPSDFNLVLYGAIAKHLLLRQDKDLFPEYLESVLNIYVPQFIACKKEPSLKKIEASSPIFKFLTDDLFKRILLPAIKKAMLRNPEVLINCMPALISDVAINLDMSPYASEIGGTLITSLYSQSIVAQQSSVKGLQVLALGCKSSNAVEELLKQIFSVLGGSDGKLTVIDQKLSLLEGAGKLSVVLSKFEKNDNEQIIRKAIEFFANILQKEVTEKAICYGLEMLLLWTSNIKDEIPKNLLELIKTGLKSSSSVVRVSYLSLMFETLKNTSATLIQAKEITPVLLKSVENAVNQPLQIPILMEGLYAALILLNNKNMLNENGFHSLNAVFDMDKQIFFSEKCLTGIKEECLINVLQLALKLLLTYSKKISGDTLPLYQAIFYCLLSTPSNLRRKYILALKLTINESLEDSSFIRSFLKHLEEFFKSEKAKAILIKKNAENKEESDISPQAIVDTILTICCSKQFSTEDNESIALDSLLPCHYPVVYKKFPNLWIKVLNYFNLKPKNLISRHNCYFNKKLIEDFNLDQAAYYALSTVSFYNPEVILPPLIQDVTSKLQDPKICQITKDEYFTYLTPEGELYDKSVFPGDESNIEINMKRESKAYSYKEQLEELQLRRELEEKKRMEGKIKQPQYTPKQLETINNQKVKEQAIRNNLTKLHTTIKTCEAMIKAVSKGNPVELSLNFKNLLPVLIKNFQSPLAAPIFTELFLDLQNIVFTNNLLGRMIANLILRVLKPKCDLNPEWEQEDLHKAITRVIDLIHTKNTNSDVKFTSAAFSYFFPLLQNTLILEYNKKNEEVMHHGLQIISEQAKYSPSRYQLSNLNESFKSIEVVKSDKDIYHPQFLPIKNMLDFLILVISKTSGRMQSQSQACLLDVAACLTGNEGCTTPSREEINVLLEALQSPLEIVRDSVLRTLLTIVNHLPNMKTDPEYALILHRRIFIAKFDHIKENSELAEKLWFLADMEFLGQNSNELLPDIGHYCEPIQAAAARALGYLFEENKASIKSTLDSLLIMYNEKLQMIPAQVDEFGREIEKAIDTWQPRRGVGLALYQLAPLMNPEQIGDIVQFFVSHSLSDRKDVVRKEMLNAALRIVDLHGKETVGTLWPVFDIFMSKTSKSAHFDAVKQAVVILMGSLARHLEQDDPKIKPIVLRLIQALSTPSQSVQEAVANCLHPLCGSVKDEIPGLINKLLHQLLKGDKYGERKGAAYGIASIIKGIGILGLKQYDIMTKLTEAIQDKKNYKFREGALFAFEMLFQMLGKLFEPYIVHVLPHLLQCFGDSSQHVRTAADDTAKVIMSKLSGHGVKLILPSLLEALNEDSWRTKTGSVELLGAMAYCAPKQLSSCLPSIVPKLIEVLSDSHMKVQEAGATALKVIGSVIRNPEIQAIVPVLLRALQDPSKKTSVCLQTLLDTQFVHFIDAPSLALIMPVVQRAFMDRSTETRKMAAQIIGNMYSLTDQKDLVPYLPTIIPGLKTSLLDPVPEVRSVSARALGAMVRGMGESSFEDLLPWLMQTLTSESSSVDRSGAAQGLSEVVGGLGVEKLHKLMPEIIATAERTDIAPHVKDGYIMMFIYMPAVFNNDFTPYIGQIITPILKALSDENEYVRDTALKAGQRIVTLYADSAILLLLPELEKGLFDENWRIRHSSVQLLGDLLYRISGVTGKMSTETASEDDNFGTEQSHHAIINALGAERRNRVLAGLYMGRSDVALMVRQAALHVWKVVVTNTPRTLREILPTLFGLLLGCLASDSYDKRQVAARTLGDLVRKLGERVLPEIIPILERGLESDTADQRQGVCIGLSEIMASTSKDMVLTFVNSLVPTVRKALCDPLPEVRFAAAKTFDSLHSTVGSKALDDIIPAMLNQLNSDNPQIVEWTLDGLRQMMSIKSRVVLPYLVPQLTAPPANTKALSIVASVAGEALNRFLPKILPALQMSLARSKGTPEEAQEFEYCQAVILSVVDESGTRIVVDTILENTRNENPDIRRAATTLLCSFCTNSKANYLPHVPQLLRGLIHLCTDTDPDVLKMAWEALNAVTKTLDTKQLPTYVSDIRQAVRFAVSDMKGTSTDLPGFCIQKGIAPLLPIFREAILNGDIDDKEMAALGLGEIIRVTSDKALQPSVVHITGPLIRILGDRFTPNVKIAVLDALAILLSKVGIMLKQFLPQLQTTFIKSLNDSNRGVRLKSAQALRYLILIHQRPDPLFTELHNTLLKSDDAGIRETTLHGLRGIVTLAGDKISESIRKQLMVTLINMLSHSDDVARSCASGCLGALCRWLQPKELSSVLSEELLNDSTNDLILRQSRSAALSVTLKECPEMIWTEYEEKIVTVLLNRLSADNVVVNLLAVRSCGYLFNYLMLNELPLPHQLMVQFARAMNNVNNEVKQHFVKLCIHIAKNVSSEKIAPEFLKIILPGLVNGTKEKNIYVKANSEIALMTILKLKEGDYMQNKCLNILDIGARESLSDVVSKVLRKIQYSEGKEEELDDTLLT